jgi:hypothetical protein
MQITKCFVFRQQTFEAKQKQIQMGQRRIRIIFLQGLLTPSNESLCLSRWLLAGATLKILAKLNQ